MIDGCRSGVGTTRVQSPAQLVATDGRRNRITIVDSGFHFAAFLVVVPSRHAEVFELMARVVVVREQIHGVEQLCPHCWAVTRFVPQLALLSSNPFLIAPMAILSGLATAFL